MALTNSALAMVLVFLIRTLVYPLFQLPRINFSLKTFSITHISRKLFYLCPNLQLIIMSFWVSSILFYYQGPQHGGRVVLQGPNKEGFYCLDHSKHYHWYGPSSSLGECKTMDIWHGWIGHPLGRIVKSIVSSHFLPVSKKNYYFCQPCHMTKGHKFPFPSIFTIYEHPLGLIVLDLWGPAPLVSNNGLIYYIVFMDVFSRYLWIFPLAKKFDALNVFISFKHKIERIIDCKIRTFQSENGGEYLKLKKFPDSKLNSHCFSCPHTPEHNDLAECCHKQIVEIGLALLTTASIPTTYWDHEAFQTACYLVNRLPSSVHPTKSPLELLFKTTLNYTQLCVFWYECYPHLRTYSAHKLAPRSLPYFFLSYSPLHNLLQVFASPHQPPLHFKACCF